MIDRISAPPGAGPSSDLLIEMANAALTAADPQPATSAAIHRSRDHFEIAGSRFPWPSGVRIIAFGKAAAAMALGAQERLDGLPCDGLIVTNHPVDPPAGLELIVAGHPVPTTESLRAGHLALELATSVPAGWLVLYLVSGGGSSLLALPAPGVTLAEAGRLTEHLLMCGTAIDDLNTVRRHLSQVKGGRLGAATAGPYATLALSDVVGSAPPAIASGPTVDCQSTPSDALEIIDRHRGHFAVADSILAALHSRATTRPPVRPFAIVGDGAMAARAAATIADAAVLSTSLVGEAREAAARAIAAVPAGTIGVFAGETTVAVIGDGIGGRNQEAAVAAALAIDGHSVGFLSLGTDGIDGPTPAAGAVVDGTTAARARSLGLSLPDALDRNDTHPALVELGCAIFTGPTGTNVGDVWIIDRRGDRRLQGREGRWK